MNALRSSKFAQIGPSTAEFGALERLSARKGSKFAMIGPPTAKLGTLERLMKSPKRFIMKKNGVATFSQLFLSDLFYTCRR